VDAEHLFVAVGGGARQREEQFVAEEHVCAPLG
jgi:hypothetical protein